MSPVLISLCQMTFVVSGKFPDEANMLQEVTVCCRPDTSSATLRFSSQGPPPAHAVPARVASMQFPASVLVEQAPAANRCAASQPG